VAGFRSDTSVDAVSLLLLAPHAPADETRDNEKHCEAFHRMATLRHG
jgi:hypothetical protein